MIKPRAWLAAFLISGVMWFGMVKCALAVREFFQRPPHAYQGDTQASIVFNSQRATTALCEIVTRKDEALACATGPHIWAPNPCTWSDPYAQLLCHEMAHVNGWPGTHPK